MLERLASDAAFGVPVADIRGAAEPSRYVGRAPEQVDEFLAEVIAPLLAGAPPLAEREEVRV